MIPSAQTTIFSASLEIFSLLLGAFLLGALLAWILKPQKQYVAVNEEELEKFLAITQAKNIFPGNNKQENLQAQNQIQAIKKSDDLTLIYGINKKTEALLIENNILSYQDIIDAGIDGIDAILKKEKGDFSQYKPFTWLDQAQSIVSGRWKDLEEYQKILREAKKKS